MKDCEHNWESAGAGAGNDNPYIHYYFKCTLCGETETRESLLSSEDIK